MVMFDLPVIWAPGIAPQVQNLWKGRPEEDLHRCVGAAEQSDGRKPDTRKGSNLDKLLERVCDGANHLKSPTAALGEALEGLEQGKSVPSVASEWCGSLSVAFGLMQGKSSDDEHDLLPSDEEGEHNVPHHAVLFWALCVQSALARFSCTKKSCVRWL